MKSTMQPQGRKRKADQVVKEEPAIFAGMHVVFWQRVQMQVSLVEGSMWVVLYSSSDSQPYRPPFPYAADDEEGERLGGRNRRLHLAGHHPHCVQGWDVRRPGRREAAEMPGRQVRWRRLQQHFLASC